MGNKKKCVNTDPTMSMIRDIFQENLQLVNRVQRKSKSDIVTKYDLTEKLCARWMKAVAHLMPEMQERYAKTYPEIDIKSEFADIASLPVLSYDIIASVLCGMNHMIRWLFLFIVCKSKHYSSVFTLCA